MILSIQVAKFLDSQEVGSYSESTEGNIYIDFTPEGGEKICINNRVGRKSDSMSDYRTAGIQVIYKGTENPIESLESAEKINNTLHGFSGFFIPEGNEIVSCLNFQGGPYFLGVNNEGKFEYTMNYLIEYKL